MAKALTKIFLFLIVMTAMFVYVGHTITVMTGGDREQTVGEGINAGAGEKIFFGKGKCGTCHSIGERGSAIRCPNLGLKGNIFTKPIGERAADRAAERSARTGREWRAVDHLFECVAEPGAYVVSGFRNEMPIIYKPPIALKPDEVKAVIMFLASMGSEIPAEEILRPTGIAREYFDKIEASVKSQNGANTAAKQFKLYIKGDAKKGESLFWDTTGKAGCAKCHSVSGKGGNVGPPLTSVGGTRTPEYIIESILKPSAKIAGGYQPVIVLTKERERISGTKRDDTADHLTIGTASGKLVTVKKSDIRKWKVLKKSIMPDNFREILTVQELHDIVAYLLTLT